MQKKLLPRLAERLEREWRLLDEGRPEQPKPSQKLAIDVPRLKVGRFDEPETY